MMSKLKHFINGVLLISTLSCSQDKKTVFLGTFPFIISMDEDYVDFTFDKIESKSLLKLIGDNAYSFELKKDIKSLISKADNLILSIGLFDLLKGIYYENSSIRYQYLPSVLELFELDLYHIISSLYEYNKHLNITLLSLFNPYLFEDNSFYYDIDLSVDYYNLVIKNISEEFNAEYLDIKCLSSYLIAFNTCSKEGKEIIMRLINNE